MSRRSVLGWQTSLADLSLVLFLVAAASVGHHHREAKAPQRSTPAAAPVDAAPAQAEPLAVYAATADAPPLAQWLASQAADPRQQLTVTARYGSEPGAQARALAQAARLLAEAQAQGRAARVVIEPGTGPAQVALAYDESAPPQLARGLLGERRTSDHLASTR